MPEITFEPDVTTRITKVGMESERTLRKIGRLTQSLKHLANQDVKRTFHEANTTFREANTTFHEANTTFREANKTLTSIRYTSDAVRPAIQRLAVTQSKLDLLLDETRDHMNNVVKMIKVAMHLLTVFILISLSVMVFS